MYAPTAQSQCQKRLDLVGANHCMVESELLRGLAGAIRVGHCTTTALGLLTALLCVAHAGYFCYSLPLSGHASTYVCYLEYHT